MANDSDPAGLICAYDLDGTGAGHPLGWQDITAPIAQNTVRWIHLDFEEPAAQAWILKSSGISRSISEALLDDDSRPRAIQQDEGLLVILRGVNLNEGARPDDMVSIRVWLEKDRIVSTRRRKLQSISTIRRNITDGEGPLNSADFLLQLVNKLGDRVEPMIDRLDEQIEQAELKFDEDGVSTYRGELSAMRRQAAQIRRYLAPQREALANMAKDYTPLLSDANRFILREEAERVTRNLETLDLIRERAMVAQEEIIAKLALEQNSRMYILAIVAAIFLPLSFVTGMMGMNVAGLPGLDNENGFAITTGLMLLAGGLIIAVFKFKKWM